MNLEPLQASKAEVEQQLRAYKGVSRVARDADERYKSIELMYETLASGKPVIQLINVIHKAGFGRGKLPRLGFATAGDYHCDVDIERSQITYTSRKAHWNVRLRSWAGAAPQEYTVPAPFSRSNQTGSDHVPVVPPAYVPADPLANYRILWEADWKLSNHEPQRVDPALLKPIGAGGRFFELIAVWDLTPLEAAALSMHE